MYDKVLELRLMSNILQRLYPKMIASDFVLSRIKRNEFNRDNNYHPNLVDDCSNCLLKINKPKIPFLKQYFYCVAFNNSCINSIFRCHMNQLMIYYLGGFISNKKNALDDFIFNYLLYSNRI
jgi:hypothetical protein